MDDQFVYNGCMAFGTWKFSHNNQVVTLTGGGYCGWTCPAKVPNESEAAKGGWHIKLTVLAK